VGVNPPSPQSTAPPQEQFVATRTAARTQLTRLADDELAARYQSGSREALEVLIERYRRFARAKARGYFLIGGDADDVEQEALIGLYKAARDFRPGHDASFRAFAELCITRQIITAIKTATRQKHQPLNQYLSISGVRGGDDAGERSVEELLLTSEGDGTDPADRVVQDQRMRRMGERMGEILSALEIEVLELYVAGKSYQEISEHLGRHVKAVDNALQRIKRKLDQHLRERERDDHQQELAELVAA
jgi:RNA polymerase sporulation-specific sigma factor